MAAQEARNGLDQLILGLVVLQAALGAGEEYAAQHISLGENRGGAGHQVGVAALTDGDGGGALLVLIDLAAFHDLLQGGGDLLVGQLPPARTGGGNAAVPVGDNGDLAGGLVQGFAHLAGEVAQPAHQGIFFEDDPAVLIGIDLQRVALPDSHGPADLLGDYDAPQIVRLCQLSVKK